MNFLNPAMLGGLAALAIPIIVHLLNRRRFRKIPWAAMRFLQVSLERNQRRMKIEDWILLLLRLAIVALIVLALARPATDWIRSGFLGPKVTSAVIIDSSGSMSRKDLDTEGTRFERALASAAEIVESLPSGSAASLVFAADTKGSGIIEPTHNIERVESELAAPKPTHRSSDLLAAITTATTSLEGRPATGRELVIVTDGDATAWRQFDSITRTLEAAGDELRTIVVLVGGTPAENLAVTRLVQSTPVAAVGQPLRLAAEVTNFGSTDAEEIPLQLAVDGEPAGDPVIIESLPPGGSRSVTLFAQLPSPGYHKITATVPGGDATPIDDERLLVVRAIERERALLVDGQPDRDPTRSETFFLQNALVPVPAEAADSFFIAADRVTLTELPTTELDDYKVIFLANVAEFPAAVADRLTEFVRGGGGLVVFPGANVNRSFYNSELHDKRKLLPAAFGDIVTSGEDGGLSLQASGYDHPLVELWNDPGAGTLADARVNKAFALELGESGRAKIVLRFGNGNPAVIESDFGLGKVYQFSSTADTEWNDLPVRAAFLPIVHRLFGGVLAHRDTGLNLGVGEVFVRRLPESLIGKEIMIYPTGAAATKASLTKVEPGGAGARAIYAELETAGAYELAIPDPPQVVPFAVTADPRESDAEPLAQAQLDRLGELAEVITLNGDAQLATALGQSRGGAELWPLLLLAAGAIAIIELFLSQRFSKAK